MIKHIVMWKLKQQAAGKSRATNSMIIKEKLQSLNGRIPGMLRLEVGINFSKTEDSCDLVLYSEFESKEDLDKYQNHPEHKVVMPLIAAVKAERKVVDYES